MVRRTHYSTGEDFDTLCGSLIYSRLDWSGPVGSVLWVPSDSHPSDLKWSSDIHSVDCPRCLKAYERWKRREEKYHAARENYDAVKESGIHLASPFSTGRIHYYAAGMGYHRGGRLHTACGRPRTGLSYSKDLSLVDCKRCQHSAKKKGENP